MSVLSRSKLALNMETLVIDHDPTSTATDAPKGSLGIRTSGTPADNLHYIKQDDGSTTNWVLLSTTANTDWVKLSTATPSGVATLDITTNLDSTYDTYVVEITDLVPATDDVTLDLQISLDAGVSWKAGVSDYEFALQGNTSGGGGDNQNDLAHSSIRLNSNTGNKYRWGSGTGEGGRGRVTIQNPAGTALYKTALFEFSTIVANHNVCHTVGNGAYVAAVTAVDGLRFLFSGGNIESGTFTLWGRKA